MEDLKEWIEDGGNVNKKIQEKGLEGITLLELNCGVKKNDLSEEDLRLKIATYLIEKGCDVNLFNYVNGFVFFLSFDMFLFFLYYSFSKSISSSLFSSSVQYSVSF